MSESPQNAIAAVGGLMLYSERPAELAAWYARHFGLKLAHAPDFGAWFVDLPYRDLAGDERYAVFAVLTTKKRAAPEGQLFTCNLRVNDLSGLVQRLRGADWEVTDIEDHPEGRFAWTHDLDGNRLELWQDSGRKVQPQAEAGTTR